jgi:hypothetical protein
VAYEYDVSGKLNKYTVFTFDPDSKALVKQRHFEFLYAGNSVTKIVGYLPDAIEAFVQYDYTYLPDGRVSNIKETNVNGINSEANFAYNNAAQSTKVSYTFSNGGSFEYEYQMDDGNLVADKTTRGEQLCSEGQYTYDDHVNPFSKFGYVDYLLLNLSENNRLSENVTNTSCFFPSFVPQSYAYEYDDKGFPTLITTFYKSGSTIAKSKKEIFYTSAHH